MKRLWSETESNRRHEDFQSSALPTELSDHTNFLNKFSSIKNTKQETYSCLELPNLIENYNKQKTLKTLF